MPGRSVRFVARLATVLAVSYAETAAALGHPRAYVTGTPIRSLRRRRPRRGARDRSAAGPASGSCWCSAARRPCAGSTTPSLAALPRLVERVRVVHVTGDAGYAAALAAREPLPADLRDRYRPYPFLYAEMTAALAAADLAVGRAGASTLAEAAAFALPMAIVPYPHAGGHQRRNAEISRGGRRGDPGRGRGPRRRPAGRGRGAARRPGAPRRHVRGGARPRPARRRRRGRATSCSRSRAARRARRRPRSRRSRRGPRDRMSAAAARAFDAARRRDRHPAPDRRQDLARRAARPVHHDARRRPGRPVRRRPQPVRAARPRALRARALDPAVPARARQRPRHRRRGHPRPRRPGPGGGRRSVDGERYHADAGVPMARAATESQKAGLTGLEYGLAIPGTVGGAVWANAGAHESDTAGVLASATVVLADGTEARDAAPRARVRLPPQPVQGRRGAGGRRSRRGRAVGDVRAPPRRPGRRSSARLDEIRRWRQAHQPLGPAVGGLRVPQPAGRLGRPPDRRARAQGPPHRRGRRVREAR